MAIADNFWEACDQSGGPDACWPWLRAISNRGYGILRVDGALKPAHRHAYQLVKGAAAPHLVVMHSCDNRKCVNPAHLSVGSHADNVWDAIGKGRHNWSRPEDNPGVRLSAQDVRMIRFWLDHGFKPAKIAEQFACTYANVAAIKSGRTWKGV